MFSQIQDESSFDDASYIDNSIENDGNVSEDSDPDLDLKFPVKQLIDEIQSLKPLNVVPITFPNGNPLLTPQGSGWLFFFLFEALIDFI